MLEKCLVAWILAGFAAGMADYSLGVGFGLAASSVLVLVFGVDPRSSAGNIALAQLATLAPALVAHYVEGNISYEDLKNIAPISLLLGVSSTATGIIASLAISLLDEKIADNAYLATLILLLVLTLAPTAWKTSTSSHKRLFLAIYGCFAGLAKAIVGGGYTALFVSAKKTIGVDARKAIALTPLTKLAPFVAIGLAYTAGGFVSLQATGLLVVGSLPSTILAARVVNRSRGEYHSAIVVSLLATGIVVKLLDYFFSLAVRP